MALPHFLCGGSGIDGQHRLDIDRITAAMRSAGWARLHYSESIDSTNRVLLDNPPIARQVDVALTELQTAGRGRRGRAWIAPASSSVLMSVSLPWPSGAPPTYGSMLAALAVSDAICETTHVRPSLKWPNDILIGGRKVAGILTEFDEKSTVSRVVAGIGINVNFDPRNYPPISKFATSLQNVCGVLVDREGLILSLLRGLDLWYRDLTEDSTRIFLAWQARLELVGASVSVDDATGMWGGVVAGIRPDGSLEIRTADGSIRCVYAADVSLRTHRGDFTTS